MRICILANAMAVHTQRWARALSERGHEVTVLSIRSADIPGVRVLPERIGPVNSASRIWTLLSYLRLLLRVRPMVRQASPDVVNAHFCLTHGVIATLAGIRPRVVNLWGSDVLWDGAGPMPYWRRLLLRLSISSADAVVSTSHFMLAEATRVVNDVPRSSVVPFGVDLQRFSPQTDRGHCHDRPLVVGFIKTFKRIYAPEVFLEAASIAVRRYPNLRFVMAGRGPELGRCRRLAVQLGIADRVRFAGFVEHEDVPALMKSLDILVNCSRSESFGVVICEASASGIPIVATDVGGVRETVKEGETGILVPKDDPEALARALCELCEDADLRRRMGEHGRRMVSRHFDWSENVAAFERVLAECAKRHDSQPV